MPQDLVAIHHPNNYDPSVEGEAMQRESSSTQMSNQFTRRDFAIRTAGFGLVLGLAPAATLAEAEQASPSETSPAVADPYSLVDPELLPALKQFPAFDLSADMVGKFRQLPGMPPLPVPAPQPVERHIPGPHEQVDRTSKKTWSTRGGSSTPESQPSSWSCVALSTDSTSSCRTLKSPNNSARVGRVRCAKHSPLAKLFSREGKQCLKKLAQSQSKASHCWSCSVRHTSVRRTR